MLKVNGELGHTYLLLANGKIGRMCDVQKLYIFSKSKSINIFCASSHTYLILTYVNIEFSHCYGASHAWSVCSTKMGQYYNVKCVHKHG